jgi:hypothetical protein
LDSLTFEADHIFDQSAPKIEPNTQNSWLKEDGIPDWLGHFSQDDINVDPINNDANGEQLVCISGAYQSEGQIQQFFGRLSVTVGDKEGGGGDPGTGSSLTPEETAEAISDIVAIQDTIASQNDQKILTNKDANKLTRQIGKAIDNLNESDPGTAIFNLSIFQTQVQGLVPDVYTQEEVESLYIDPTGDVIQKILAWQND